MEANKKQAAAAGLVVGLLCGLALGGIIGGGWYWSTQRPVTATPARRPQLRPVPPVARLAPVPAGQTSLTPPDAVDAWKHYSPPTTPLATPPSISSPYGALPTRRMSLVAGRIGDKIVTVGGFCRTPNYFLEVNEILDLTSRAWRNGARHPLGLESAAGAVVDGKLYVAGGFDGWHRRAEMFAYDPIADAWEARAPMPCPRQGAMATAFTDDKIYFIGWEAQFQDQYMVQVYDPANDAWEARTAPCEAGYYAAVAAMDDRIFVFGGTARQAGRRKNEVMVYYPAADRWEQATAMPVARHACAAAIWEDKIYVFGGQDNPAPGGSYSAMSRVDIYDPATDRWTRARDMAQPRVQLSAITVDDGILLLGGSDGNSNPYDAAELYVP